MALQPQPQRKSRNCPEEGKTYNRWLFLIGFLILIIGLILGIWVYPVWDTANLDYYRNLIIILIIFVIGGIILGISSFIGKRKSEDCEIESKLKK